MPATATPPGFDMHPAFDRGGRQPAPLVVHRSPAMAALAPGPLKALPTFQQRPGSLFTSIDPLPPALPASALPRPRHRRIWFALLALLFAAGRNVRGGETA